MPKDKGKAAQDSDSVPDEPPPPYKKHTKSGKGSSSTSYDAYSDASAPAGTETDTYSEASAPPGTTSSDSLEKGEKGKASKRSGRGGESTSSESSSARERRGSERGGREGRGGRDKHRNGCCCEACRCMDCCYVAEGRTYSACCIGTCGVAVCLAVVGVVLAVVFLALYLRCLDTREVDMFHKNLPLNSSFTDLVIRTSNGDVSIDTSPSYDQVKFKFDVEMKNKKRLSAFKERVQNLTISDDGVVEIDSTAEETGFTNVWWCPDIVSVVVQVPEGAWEAGSEPAFVIHSANGDITLAKLLGGSIELETGSGAVTVDTVDSTKLTVVTSTGSVTLTDVTAVEDLSAETSNGEIEVKDVVVGEVAEFRTSSGSIALKDVTAYDLTARTSNGEIVFDDVSVDTIEAETSSGSVSGSVELRGDDDCVMEVVTSNGEIVFDTLSSHGSRSVACEVSLETSSGEIDVSLDGFNGKFTTETSSGDVSTSGQAKSNGNIGSGNGGDEFEFVTSNGDISVGAKNA